MGHEDHLRGDGVAVQAKTTFGRGDQIIHDLADVVYVQARAVEGAVVGFAAEQFHHAAHTPFAHGVFAFDDEGAGAHAHNGAVAALVKGERRFFQAVFDGGCTHAQEAGPYPFHHVVAGHVVRADDDHAAAATGANPIFGNGHGLGGGGAGGVDLRVGAARADVLGKLAVPHGQNTEQEAAVKDVRFALQFLAELVDAAVDFLGCAGIFRIPPQIFQHLQLRQPVLVEMVARHLVRKAVAAGEGAGKDNARFISQAGGQHPAVGQRLAGGGAFIRHHQGNARFAQGVQPGSHSQLGGNVQRFDQFCRHAILCL